MLSPEKLSRVGFCQSCFYELSHEISHKQKIYQQLITEDRAVTSHKLVEEHVHVARNIRTKSSVFDYISKGQSVTAQICQKHFFVSASTQHTSACCSLPGTPQQTLLPFLRCHLQLHSPAPPHLSFLYHCQITLSIFSFAKAY